MSEFNLNDCISANGLEGCKQDVESKLHKLKELKKHVDAVSQINKAIANYKAKQQETIEGNEVLLARIAQPKDIAAPLLKAAEDNMSIQTKALRNIADRADTPNNDAATTQKMVKLTEQLQQGLVSNYPLPNVTMIDLEKELHAMDSKIKASEKSQEILNNLITSQWDKYHTDRNCAESPKDVYLCAQMFKEKDKAKELLGNFRQEREKLANKIKEMHEQNLSELNIQIENATNQLEQLKQLEAEFSKKMASLGAQSIESLDGLISNMNSALEEVELTIQLSQSNLEVKVVYVEDGIAPTNYPTVETNKVKAVGEVHNQIEIITTA